MRAMPLLILLLIPTKAVLASDDPADAARAGEARERRIAVPSTLPFIPPAPGQERYRLVEQNTSGTDQQAAEIRGAASQTLTPIVQVDNPPVESYRYVVRGRVKYENVAGTAYLEMWSDFVQRAPTSPARLRTLVPCGPFPEQATGATWSSRSPPNRG